MKKNLFIVSLVLVLGIVSCERKPKVITGSDIVVVEQGKMAMYDMRTKELKPYEKETDSVMNLLFDDSNHLYYTASNKGNMSLKMLDLNVKNAVPRLCVDLNMTVDDATDFMSGRVADLLFDVNGENIFIYRMDTVLYYMRPMVYNIKTGSFRETMEDEVFDIRYNRPNCNTSHLYTEDHLFYNVTPEGKYCLNDKIDFSIHFPDEEERNDLEFTPYSISPDGNTMVYSAAVYWGEGWGHYCVANLDGSMQTLLSGSDIWDYVPQWLPDGTLAYVGEAPLPESDPDYDAEWNSTQPCVKIFDPKLNASTTISLGRVFAVRPTTKFEWNVSPQKDLEGCDVAIFDEGKVTFYNSLSDEFIPYVLDDDSIINGTFVDEYAFYYTVKIGNELYLKQIFLGEYTSPLMVTDWELTLDDCVSETYGKASPLIWVAISNRIGINHNFSWDYYNFADIRFYDLDHETKLNGWINSEVDETDDYDEDLFQYEEDLEHFRMMDGQYYYIAEDQEICLSDRIDFKSMASDPSYYSDPEFEFCSIDPTRKNVAYIAYIEWGDLGHGPLCIASLDGKMQQAFADTDAADLTYGWMQNGSLLYVGTEDRPIDDPEYNAEWNTTKPCVKIVKSDGTFSVFSHSTDFVVKGK